MRRIKKAKYITELRKQFGIIWQKANKKTWDIDRFSSSELSESTYSRKTSEGKNTIHKESYFSIGDKLYQHTSKIERSFLFETIAPLLKLNNAIIPKPTVTERENRVLNRLISIGIINRVGRCEYIIVNPEFLRRGSIINVIGATYDRLKMAEETNCSLYVKLTPQAETYRNFLDEEHFIE